MRTVTSREGEGTREAPLAQTAEEKNCAPTTAQQPPNPAGAGEPGKTAVLASPGRKERGTSLHSALGAVDKGSPGSPLAVTEPTASPRTLSVTLGPGGHLKVVDELVVWVAKEMPA